MKRIGLLGGSFNPPQLGHLAMAEHLYHFAGCDEVWLLVTPQNPFKDPAGYAALDDRMEMCRLMSQDYPWLKPNDIEKEFGCIRTSETLENLRAHFPDDQFVWSMGGDNLLEFHTWEGWQEILSHHPVVVFGRPGSDGILDCTAMQAARKSGNIIADAGLMTDGATGFLFCDNELLDVSSTQVRDALTLDRNKCPRGLHPAVHEYVLEKGLFKAGKHAAESVAKPPGYQPD